MIDWTNHKANETCYLEPSSRSLLLGSKRFRAVYNNPFKNLTNGEVLRKRKTSSLAR
jgi:hypothetical protein